VSDKSKIEWTDATWNPVRGCSILSAGCTNCYAMGVADRFSGPGLPYDGLTLRTTQGPKWNGKIILVREALSQPLKWRRERQIFVNSMSDLFHDDVPDSFIDQVFAVMALASQHTFQVLTKRAVRMHEYYKNFSWARVVESCTGTDGASTIPGFTLQALKHHFGQCPDSALNFVRRDVWPLPNLWLGVSTENQATVNSRVPTLLMTPASVRFVSAEPLLGEIDLFHVEVPKDFDQLRRPWDYEGYTFNALVKEDEDRFHQAPAVIDQVIAGGESGRNARPTHPAWIRGLRDQCAQAGVAFHFKQWGEWAPGEVVERDHGVVDTAKWFNGGWTFGKENLASFEASFEDEPDLYRIGKRAAGRVLDGIVHDEYPEAA